MRILNPIYTKPMVKNISMQLLRWPRSAELSRVGLKVGLLEFLPQKTIIIKKVLIEASPSRIWSLIGNPMNIPIFCEGVLSIKPIDEKTYEVTDVVPPKNGDEWGTITFKEQVVEAIPGKLIRYRLFIEKEGTEIGEDYIFELEAKDNKTIVSMKMETEFKVNNSDEVDDMMENVLTDIGRLSMSKEKLLERINAYKEKNNTSN